MAHYNLAMGYWGKKRWDDAERELRVGLTIAPSFAESYLALAALPRARGEGYWKKRLKQDGRDAVLQALLQSEADFRRSFLLNPLVDLRVLGKFEGDESQRIVLRGNYFLVLSPPWWSKEATRGINEFREGRYDRAFQRFDSIIQGNHLHGADQDAPDPVLWYHGLAAAHLGDFERSIRDFAVLTGRAVAQSKDRERDQVIDPFALEVNDLRYMLATMRYLGGHYSEAIGTYQRTLEFDLSLYMAHVQMARMYEAARMWPKAITERRRAVEANSSSADLLADLGSTLLLADSAAEAEEPLQMAERMNPRDARVPYLLGMVESRLGHRDASREAYLRFLAIAPGSYASQLAEVRSEIAKEQ